MLASSLASFPCQLRFISSNISIKHLVSSHYGAQLCTGCLFLKEMKGKSICLAHVEDRWVAGQADAHRQCFETLRGWLDLRQKFLALSLGETFPNLPKPLHPSCSWGLK